MDGDPLRCASLRGRRRMSSTQQILGARRGAQSRVRRLPWPFRPRGSDTGWAVAFVVPYMAVFLAFVIYPVIYGIWLGSDPALYDMLFSDPKYLTIVVNTLLFVGI